MQDQASTFLLFFDFLFLINPTEGFARNNNRDTLVAHHHCCNKPLMYLSFLCSLQSFCMPFFGILVALMSTVESSHDDEKQCSRSLLVTMSECVHYKTMHFQAEGFLFDPFCIKISLL